MSRVSLPKDAPALVKKQDRKPFAFKKKKNDRDSLTAKGLSGLTDLFPADYSTGNANMFDDY